MANQRPRVREDGICVEVPTANGQQAVFGYRFASDNSGPQIVVAGTCATAEVLVRRLTSIRTLPWVRGSLVLIRLDVLDGLLGDIGKVLPLGEIERVIVLPWIDLDAADKAPLRRAYRAVLQACSDLELVSRRDLETAD